MFKNSLKSFGEPPYDDDDDDGYGGIWEEINGEEQRFIEEGEYAGDFVHQLHLCDEKIYSFHERGYQGSPLPLQPTFFSESYDFVYLSVPLYPSFS